MSTQSFKINKYGDVDIDSSTGRPITVSGKTKLRQDVLDLLESERLSDGTGANLTGLIGVIGDAYSLQADFIDGVSTSFDAYMRLQEEIQPNDRGLDESIATVTQATISPLIIGNDVSPTDYAYQVHIRSKAFQPLIISGVLVS